MRILLILLMFLAFSVRPALAADASPLKQMLTTNDSRGWEAVGRLDLGGRSFCTGVLVAPDQVLTAAHCLYDRRTGELLHPSDIEFLAGWRNGRANAHRRVARAVTHSGFQYDERDRVTRIAMDLALLELQAPVRNASVTHFETGQRPRKGDAVGVVSYAHDRSNAPSIQEICHVLARQSGALVLSCDVDFGSSGAPIFTLGSDGQPLVVSIISAKAEVRGRQVALGTRLQDSLAELRQSLAAQPAPEKRPDQVRVLRMNTSNNASGARFLRP